MKPLYSTNLKKRLKGEEFLKIPYVRSTNPFKIDPHNKNHQVPLKEVYVGIQATETARDIEADLGQNHPDVQLFHTHCRDFLMEAVLQIQARFSDCQNLDHLSCLSPMVAYNLKIPSLSSLYKEMPHLERVAILQDVYREWRDHALDPNLNDQQTPEEYWQVVFKAKGPNGKIPRYPNLVKVVKVLLSLPFSNAAVEGLFGQLKLIKSDQRASLKQESLVALLSTKLNLNPSQGVKGTLQAVKLETSKEMLTMHEEMKTNASNDEVAELRRKYIRKLNNS